MLCALQCREHFFGELKMPVKVLVKGAAICVHLGPFWAHKACWDQDQVACYRRGWVDKYNTPWPGFALVFPIYTTVCCCGHKLVRK